jgi:ZIP family zinc transporter
LLALAWFAAARQNDTVMAGALASLLTGLATGAGALPVLWGQRMSARTEDGVPGFAAGVMLAASAFSLVLPGIEAGTNTYGSAAWSAAIAAAAIAAGAWLIRALDGAIPHRHRVSAGAASRSRQVWLFVTAIALHNVPEGLAVGVGFGQGVTAEASGLALGIGIQNLPEGLAVALAIASLGYGARYSFGIALLSGLVEPVAGLAGAWLVNQFAYVLPFALSLAAGAMLFVIMHEIIPETHRRGHGTRAAQALVAGFIVMTVLDTTLG